MPWTLPRLRASRRRHSNRAQTATSKAKHYRKWALSQVGTAESPWGSNWGPRIGDWIRASGYGSGVPWCQCFVNAAAVHGGAPQLRTGYTPTVLAGIGGYKRIPASQARAGDFVFFKFPGVSSASCDHVGILTGPPSGGIVPTVEGNTSSGTYGSQNNGGGVYARRRSTGLVAGYVRPPYPKG
jgi:hypothetical protein